ncbi:MAG: TIGR01212 family radical SAM protein [Muribaculum sp.]|nr:TIGR01212 family radical SAM protein [Muribaculum sp.]
MASLFPGIKVQKISVSSGVTCPNRDGTFGTGGCSYCDNRSFSPEYCLAPASIASQIESGKNFFARKYPQMKYLAYFQSYTNTHGHPASYFQRLWEEAADQKDVVGLIIATRPDCVGPKILDRLKEMNRRLPVILELGAETSHDRTLQRVNRHHSWADVTDAVTRSSAAGLHVGLHMIAGLPGESKSDVLQSIDRACSLPIESIKLHHLQVIKGTLLHAEWLQGDFSLLFESADQYLDFCVEVVNRIPAHIAIERFLASSPPALVAAPKWGLKNYEFTNALHNRLRDGPSGK